ncbi:hypothetical protein DY000_02014978 [Brassica cretica]|uniref:Uncharacterized protein n=1 Tax=Brassica cretica TaxID=69181 RepID=A0ABQ7CSB5_BRACR|nr:hypothetical protein DY000_02014978 [Brassica cretica]
MSRSKGNGIFPRSDRLDRGQKGKKISGTSGKFKELNTLHQTWYCKLPRITLPLQCNPIIYLIYGLMEHSPNVLFSFFGLSEEHPQSLGQVGFLEWFLQWNPEDSLKKIVHLLLISSLLQMLSNLFLSLPQAEGFGGGLSALTRAMSIFGNCTRNVRGARRSMGAGCCQSVVVSCCRSMASSVCRSMLT